MLSVSKELREEGKGGVERGVARRDKGKRVGREGEGSGCSQ